MSRFFVSGYQAINGQRYCRVESDNGSSALLPIERFNVDNRKLGADLTAAGLTIYDKADLAAIIGRVSVHTDFGEGGVAEHVGWNGDDFACRDGTVFGDSSAPEQIPILFSPDRASTANGGKLIDWQKLVAKPLQRHPVPAFALMAMFAAPLMRFMPGPDSLTFEIVGDVEVGRSSILALAASAVGAPSYVKTLREVLDQTADTIANHRDYPLLIDDVAPSLMASSKSQLKNAFQTVTFTMPRVPGGRVTLLACSRPLHDTCNMNGSSQLIISLPISTSNPDREHDLSQTENINAILARSLTNHGVAFPVLLHKLRRYLIADRNKMIAHTIKFYEKFLKAAATVANDGEARRLAQSFAVVYAAGKIAASYGALPWGYPCRKIALAAYQLCLDRAAAPPAFRTRLEELVASGRLVTITTNADRGTQAEVARQALGTLTIGAKRRVIKIECTKVSQAFPDWPAINKNPDVRECMKTDGNNLKPKGRLAPGMSQERLYQFWLPLLGEVTIFESDPHQSETASIPGDD